MGGLTHTGTFFLGAMDLMCRRLAFVRDHLPSKTEGKLHVLVGWGRGRGSILGP